MYSPYMTKNSNRRSIPPPVWYIPRSAKENDAFRQAQVEIKNFLLTNKEGVSTTRIVNFLGDLGIVIPHEKFGLSFNEFLYHCQNFIHVRMFQPYIYQSHAKFIFLNPQAVDPESRHLYTLVQEQVAEKKKSSGQPRATIRNTYLVEPSILLDAPPPFVRTGPPLSSSRGRGGVSRPFIPRFHRGNCQSRPPASDYVARTFSYGQTSLKIPAVSPATSAAPTGGSAFVGFGADPRPPTQSAFNGMAPPTQVSRLPLQRLVISGGEVGIDQIDHRAEPDTNPQPVPVLQASAATILKPQVQNGPHQDSNPQPAPVLPTSDPTTLKPEVQNVTHQDSNPQPAPVLQASASTILKPQAQNMTHQAPQAIAQKVSKFPEPSAVIQVPEGFVNPLQACSARLISTSLKKRLLEESSSHQENLIPLTLTGFKEDDPGIFFVRVNNIAGGLHRIENMMKTMYEFKPEAQPKVSKKELVVNGIYGGLDRASGEWRRVQVVAIRHDDMDGDKPVTVFLIDHGTLLDIDFDDIRYLTHFFSTGVMPQAYFASYDYLPHEPPMMLFKEAARFFMEMSTGQTFLCHLGNVETREHGPHLMLRFVAKA